MTTKSADPYAGYIAKLYDNFCYIGSFGAIPQSRLGALERKYLPQNAKVLLVGCGTAIEAFYIAKHFPDVEVTTLDISSSMLDIVNKKKEKVAPKAKITTVEADIMEYEGPSGGYDMVVLNYFLNMFDLDMVNKFVEVCKGLTKPGGHIAIGDVTCPDRHVFQKMVVYHVWWHALFLFKLLGQSHPVHFIFNYRQILQEHGMEIIERKFYNYCFQKTFECLIVRKPENSTTSTTTLPQ